MVVEAPRRGRDPEGSYNSTGTTVERSLRTIPSPNSRGSDDTRNVVTDTTSAAVSPPPVPVANEPMLVHALPVESVSTSAEHSSPEPEDVLARALQRVEKCVVVQDFVAMYNSDVYQAALGRLMQAQGTEDVEDWAKAWAIRMREASNPDDVQWNKDRKLCLQLLFGLCDACWKHHTVTETDIVETFKLERILNILQVALAMDRAQALYKMKYLGSKTHGMHWVSEQHVANSKNWQAFLNKAQRPSMNKRYIYLLQLESLGLQDIPLIREWLEPKFASLDRVEL